MDGWWGCPVQWMMNGCGCLRVITVVMRRERKKSEHRKVPEMDDGASLTHADNYIHDDDSNYYFYYREIRTGLCYFFPVLCISLGSG